MRISSIVIENFRCFLGRNEIALSSSVGAEGVIVLHGQNGSGKTTALEAIDLFFLAAAECLKARQQAGTGGLRLNWNAGRGPDAISLSPFLDWPPGVRDPLQIELWFEDDDLGGLRVRFVPTGDIFTAHLERHRAGQWIEIGEEETATLLNVLTTPRGPGSVPFFLLDVHRRGSWLHNTSSEPTPTTMAQPLVDRLHELKSSLNPRERGRWRAFTQLVERFSTFSKKGIELERSAASGGIEIRLEEPDRLILPLSRLSSGEQQLLTLCASLLTSRAAVVAIEEPELSLHPDNQALLKQILAEQVRDGVIDQIILESHATIFDSREVVRFERSTDGSCFARRAPGLGEELGLELREEARKKGGQPRYVTREGYTQLPEIMVHDLGLDDTGGDLWFVRSARRWEAWPEKELDEYLGADDDAEDD